MRDNFKAILGTARITVAHASHQQTQIALCIT